MLQRAAPACRGSKQVCLAAILAAAFYLSATSARCELLPWSGPSPGLFKIPLVTGGEIALAAQRGDVVLVHFFATWCEPCRDELPALNRLVERAREVPLKVIAISVAEPDLRVRRFLETVPARFPVGLDRDRSVAKSWGIDQLPSTVVLGRDLKPKLMVHADFAWDRIEPQQLIDRVQKPAP